MIGDRSKVTWTQSRPSVEQQSRVSASSAAQVAAEAAAADDGDLGHDRLHLRPRTNQGRVLGHVTRSPPITAHCLPCGHICVLAVPLR